jgi:hypothetical protein
MTSDRYMHVFTRSEPWAELGLLRRWFRVCRIIFGCILSSSLLLVALLAVRGILYRSGFGQAVISFLILVPVAALFAWAAGCMFIWRAVYEPIPPAVGGSPPPEPPSEGAPRPAPLRPFSPLIMSAHAELPNERRA